MARKPSADPLRRMAAMAYDGLIIAGLVVASSMVIIIARGGRAVPAGNFPFQAFVGLQVISYFVGFWSHGGQTPGMRAWKLRLVTAEGDQLPVTTALWRVLAGIVSIAPLGLGFLWMLVDSDGRAWHDRLSKTRMVRTDADGR